MQLSNEHFMSPVPKPFEALTVVTQATSSARSPPLSASAISSTSVAGATSSAYSPPLSASAALSTAVAEAKSSAPCHRRYLCHL